MSDIRPIEVFWDGSVFTPASPWHARLAAKQYAAGELLNIIHIAERSSKSHRHLFAVIADAHASLPPLMAERFSSPEALRKYLLVKIGHCDSHSLLCPTVADAKRTAAFVRPFDSFSVVTVTGTVVNVYTAKSLDYRHVDKAEFGRIKESLLSALADMIEVSKKELVANGGN